MATANIIPTVETDGILYATDVPLTSSEATLGDALKTPALIAIVEGQTLVAVVQVTVNGHIISNNAFIFLQTDLGDGVWVDVAWCQTRITDGSATFVLCGGGLGAMNNAFGPLRKSGSAPSTQANGSNAVPLGGRCRFSGFATSDGGSSSISGTASGPLATITYKLQRPR